MFFSGFPEFNINDLTVFENNNDCGDNLGFDGFNWDPSNVAGPSQPYSGVVVHGDLNGYPDFPSPSGAPTSLDPTCGVSPNEGYDFPFHQGTTMPPFSPQARITPPPLPVHPAAAHPLPAPTISYGSRSLSPEQLRVPTTHIHHSYTRPQVVFNPDDLGFGLPTAAESFSLPTVRPPPVHNPSYEELLRQWPQPDPFHLDALPFDPIIDAGPSEIPLPAPVASSSGPKRTRQPARESRRYDPVRPVRRTADLKRDSWSQTLVRFQAELDTIYSVQTGQPSGGLVPAMALARISKFVKEDLKHSPLRNAKAAEGKRSRDVEDYLKGLLKAIRPVEPTSTLTEPGADEEDTAVAALSRLADELEAKLVAVNQEPALRQSVAAPKHGRKMGGEQVEGRLKKNGSEKARRDEERHHLERISLLFKAPRQHWSKKDVLSLAVLFLLRGPGAFPGDFVELRTTAPEP